MEENQFRTQFRELSNAMLIEAIKQRAEYQPLAAKEMLEEAIDRKIIPDDSDNEINIAIEKSNSSQPEIKNLQSVNDIDGIRAFYYAASGFFALGGVLYLINIMESPLTYIVVSIFLFSIAYYIFRIQRKRSKQTEAWIKENKPKEKKEIISAFFYIFLIFIIRYFFNLIFK